MTRTDKTVAGTVAGELELVEVRVRASSRGNPGGDSWTDRQELRRYELAMRGDAAAGPDGVELELDRLVLVTPDLDLPEVLRVGQRFRIRLEPIL